MANDGTVRIGTDVDDSGFKSSLSKLGGVAKTAMVGVTAATGAASAAVGKLVKDSTDAYASYEQLVGGVETLFKTSSDKVMEYASNAYKTAGLSANEYMETVTSFSASLLQGLGGNTAAAADLADQAIVDMADNANKMGTDIAMIQNAYQGFAKQNYTMLDNLKLGYGGTQAEMARLINDSGVLGDAIEVTADTVNSVSFDKIIEAIHVVQTNMGITGTTAAEAADTIEGSANAMKAAWGNLVTGLADDDADLDALITNFVDSVSTYAKNIIPVMEQALSGIGELVEKLAPIIAEKLPELISTVVPSLLSIGTDLVMALLSGITAALPSLIPAAIDIIQTLLNGIVEALPNLVSVAGEIISTLVSSLASAIPELAVSGADVIRQLAQGFEQGLPELAAKIPEIIASAIDFLTEHLPDIMAFGVEIINSLVNGIISAIPALLKSLPQLIDSIVNLFIEYEPLLLESGVSIIKNLIDGITAAIPDFVEALPDIINSIVDFIVEALPQIISTGAQLILALIGGIISAIPDLVAALPQIISAIGGGLLNLLGGMVDVGKAIVGAIWDGIVDGIKSFLGIGGSSKSSPKSGGSSPRRAAAAPMALSDGGEEDGISTYGLSRSRAAASLETAVPNARAQVISDLATAVPAAQSRVAIATSDMAPTAAYSAPSPTSYGGNTGGGQPVQIIDRRPIIIKAEGDLAPLAQLFKPVMDAENARVGVGVQ